MASKTNIKLIFKKPRKQERKTVSHSAYFWNVDAGANVQIVFPPYCSTPSFCISKCVCFEFTSQNFYIDKP